MTRPLGRRGTFAFLTAMILFGTWSVVMPLASTGLVLALTVVGAVVALHARLPGLYSGLLGLLLLGYALFGRPFAYVGVAPLYVGELVLFLGLVVTAMRLRIASLAQSPLMWLLVAFMGYGAYRTVPYLPMYGVDALRDAVLWGYAAFAVVVASLLGRPKNIEAVVHRYERFVPVFLVVAPATMLVDAFFSGALPSVPGSDVAVIDAKAGDIAVHLVGVMAFVVLRIGRIGALRRAATRTGGWWSREWWLWIAWLAAFVTTLTSRAAFLAVVASALMLMVIRPSVRWWRPLVLALVITLVAFGAGLGVELRDGRTVSVEGLVEAAVSIVTPVQESSWDGTRSWRLEWWEDIAGYTIFGDRFWAGKGYGINLASDDGFQVFADESLRSPHSAHMSVLARSGVPGLVLWALLQSGFMVALVRAYVRCRREGRDAWADLNAWILAYWLAFQVNASFDVFLEGPQGGIWFWCLFGFGLAVLRMQEAHRPPRSSPPPARPSAGEAFAGRSRKSRAFPKTFD